MKRRRRTTWFWAKWGWGRRIALLIAAIPGLYLVAALIGGLISVNRNWVEPADGVFVMLADNGIHVDLILPAKAAGLDWRPLFPASHVARAPKTVDWFAFGSGEAEVYLNTPRWSDLTPGTAASAVAGGRRVMHVDQIGGPPYAFRVIRLRPEEYRRLWAAIRAGFKLDASGRPIRIDHAGYATTDSFYEGNGSFSALETCNQWVASRLRLAGVRAPLWSPFPTALMRRYRSAG